MLVIIEYLGEMTDSTVASCLMSLICHVSGPSCCRWSAFSTSPTPRVLQMSTLPSCSEGGKIQKAKTRSTRTSSGIIFKP